MSWIHIVLAGIFISLTISMKEYLIVIKSFKSKTAKPAESIHAWIVSGDSTASVAFAYMNSLKMLCCAVMLVGGVSYNYEKIYLSVLLFSGMIVIHCYIIYSAYSYGKSTKNSR